MKKHLDVEYMKAAVREALRVRSGIRAGKNDKPKKNDDPVVQPLYGVPIPMPKYGLVALE